MIRVAALAAVVSACLGAGGRPAQPGGSRTVAMADFRFAPADLVVSLGDTVVWRNGDAFRHTTTADSGAWASPELGKGDAFVLATARAGRFPYHCAAHPVMRGTLVVRQ